MKKHECLKVCTTNQVSNGSSSNTNIWSISKKILLKQKQKQSSINLWRTKIKKPKAKYFLFNWSNSNKRYDYITSKHSFKKQTQS